MTVVDFFFRLVFDEFEFYGFFRKNRLLGKMLRKTFWIREGIWGCPGGVREASWGVLGLSGGVRGASWEGLGRSWGDLGATLEALRFRIVF